MICLLRWVEHGHLNAKFARFGRRRDRNIIRAGLKSPRYSVIAQPKAGDAR
jgi:hypothetical protein